MYILFPKRKGVKIATKLIFEEMRQAKGKEGYFLILGMILFAAKFGAITYEEQVSLTQHLNEQIKLLKERV